MGRGTRSARRIRLCWPGWKTRSLAASRCLESILASRLKGLPAGKAKPASAKRAGRAESVCSQEGNYSFTSRRGAPT